MTVRLPLALAAMALMPLAAPADDARGGIETPHHTVAASTGDVFSGGVQLRDYAPQIVAEVTVEAEARRAASSAGFRPLASYIFGANDPNASIAMTAPVTTIPAGGGAISGGDGARIAMTAPVSTVPAEGAWTVRFTMPSRWTMGTLPAPDDPAIRLIEIPARRMLVTGFTGPDDPAAWTAAETRLRDHAAAEGIVLAGPVETAGYDGPSVAPPNKRWAVLVEVDG